MESKKCLLVEDDSHCIEVIQDYAKSIPYVNIYKVCKTYAEAVQELTQRKIDLLLLDIRLEGPKNLTGLDLLRTVVNLPPVIIVSSAPEYAIDSYEIGRSVDFLLKPFDLNRFILAINRALNIHTYPHPSLDENIIFFKMGRRFQRFDLNEIDFIEAYGIYVKVVVAGIVHVINDNITNIEKLLTHRQFMRVHKSYIVNLRQVVGFDQNTLYLKSGTAPIGISYKPRLQNFLRLFSNEEMS